MNSNEDSFKLIGAIIQKQNKKQTQTPSRRFSLSFTIILGLTGQMHQSTNLKQKEEIKYAMGNHCFPFTYDRMSAEQKHTKTKKNMHRYQEVHQMPTRSIYTYFQIMVHDVSTAMRHMNYVTPAIPGKRQRITMSPSSKTLITEVKRHLCSPFSRFSSLARTNELRMLLHVLFL